MRTSPAPVFVGGLTGGKNTCSIKVGLRMRVTMNGGSVVADGPMGRWEARLDGCAAVLGFTPARQDTPVVFDAWDVPAVTRTAIRLFTADPDKAVVFADGVDLLAGATPDAEDPPVRRLLRAAYPLLRPVAGRPVPLLPATMTQALHPVLCAPTPREAAELLAPGRATRPVVAALAAAVCGSGSDPDELLDVFPLSVVARFADRLEPDHLARLLTAQPAEGAETSGLLAGELDRLDMVVGDLQARRLVDLLETAIGEEASRLRCRYLARHGTRPAARRTRSWEDVVAHELLEPGAARRLTPAPPAAAAPVATAPDDPAPAPAPVPARPATPRRRRQQALLTEAAQGLSMHRVTSAARLRELAFVMNNCLDTYGNRLASPNVIVEFRRGDQPVFAAHLRRGRVVTLEARHNRRPDRDVIADLRELLDRGGLLSTPRRPVARERAEPQRAVRSYVGASVQRDQLRDLPVSLQALATSVIARPGSDDPDWCELAAGLWALGATADLPDPSDAGCRQVMFDLAPELAAGGVPATIAPRPDEVRAARYEALRQLAERHGVGWWSYLAMADVIARPIEA